MSHPLERLDAWVRAGLLTNEQANAITAFEEREGDGASGNRLTHAFMALGSIILAMGIISIIAANWREIPDAVKLGMDFTLLIGLGLWSWWQLDNDACCRRELPLLLFTLFCLASLGLIGQIYHLEYPWYEVILLWCALTLPVVIHSRRQVLPTLWSGGFLASLIYWYILSTKSNLGFNDRTTTATLLALPLLCALLARLLAPLPRMRMLAESFRYWFWLYAMVGVVTMELQAMRNKFDLPGIQADILLPALILTLPLSLAIVLRDPGPQARLRLGLLATYLLMAATVMLTTAPDWVAAPFTFVLACLGAIHAALLHNVHLARHLILLAGLRAYLAFVTLFSSLLATGVGLMVTGGTLLLLVYVWQRQRERLQTWLEGVGA